MKKLTLSALAAFAVVGTAFAGPCPVVSKEFKQPCATPCFKDQELQLDLFYSFNDAQHQDHRTVSDSFLTAPALTPIPPNSITASSLINNPAIVPAGSTVVTSGEASGFDERRFKDSSGGGVGLNYFFTRYVGIGVEGNWWDGIRQGNDGQFGLQDTITLNGVNAGTAAAVAAALTAAGQTNVTVVDPSTLLITRSAEFNRRNHRKVVNQVTGSLILRYPFEGPICWAPYIFGGGGGMFDGHSVGFGHIGLGVEFRVTPYMGFFTDWRWEFVDRNNDDNGEIRDFARTVGLDLDNNRNRDHNDVNMTRVGVRFVF
ncbi:MAG: hypothetical protein NTZ46_11285 [Verrucomicrobia bacterium]|nr:hypothetical protein [Verrucomicrobiota bacterium]